MVVDGMGKEEEMEGSEVYCSVNYSLWRDHDALPIAARGRVSQRPVTHTFVIKVAFLV